MFSFDIMKVMGNTVGRFQSSVPQHLQEVLVGSLLGDGRLERRSKGIRHAKTARFRVHHGEKQKSYVLWKYQQLKSIVLTGPREITRYDKKRDIHETSWYFHTQSTKELGYLHSLFYKQRRKIVPKALEKLLSPRACAIWFMDDGSNIGSAYSLCTHNMNETEQELVRVILANKYDIETTVVKDRHQTKLAINGRFKDRFTKLISSYIIPSMTYKIEIPVTTETS